MSVSGLFQLRPLCGLAVVRSIPPRENCRHLGYRGTREFAVFGRALLPLPSKLDIHNSFTMTHPQAALASPSSDPLQPQQAYDGSNGDFSSLDFLSFMGLDASTPQPELIPSPKIVHPPTYQAEAGPSTINANLPGSPIKSQRGRDYSTGRGRSKTRGTKRRGGGSSSLAQEDQSVTADPSLNLQILNNGDDGMEGVDAMGMERYGLHGEGHDAVQAGFMQQQVRSSPLNDPS